MASQTLKHLKYDGSEVYVEVAKRDGNGKIISDTYATVADLNSVKESIGKLTQFSYSIVTSLPDTGSNGVIYLVAHDGHTDSNDSYDEYLWVTDKFEKIGNTDVDLSGYQTSTDNTLATTAKTVVGGINEVNSALSSKQTALTTAQLSAANSGITSDLVSQISTNETDLAKITTEDVTISIDE